MICVNTVGPVNIPDHRAGHRETQVVSTLPFLQQTSAQPFTHRSPSAYRTALVVDPGLSAVALAVSTSPFGKLRVPSIVEGLKALSQSMGKAGTGLNEASDTMPTKSHARMARGGKGGRKRESLFLRLAGLDIVEAFLEVVHPLDE